MNHDDAELWIAESEQLPGIRCFGPTKADALAKLAERAKNIMAERRKRGLVASTNLKVIVYKNPRKD